MNWYKKAQEENSYYKSYYTDDQTMEWLTRHQIPIENGKYVFYHGTPYNIDRIRAGSYLAEDEKDARFFAQRDRDDITEANIIVHKVLVNPQDINIGVFPTLRIDYELV